MPANRGIWSITLFLTFQEIYSGCCTVAAQSRARHACPLDPVMQEYLKSLPARSTVKVAELLMGARVEIESVAVRSS
jgi:enamine deaminase RidA (YjgF/YER057c/UK114 family)